jgi:hypothetical protein
MVSKPPRGAELAWTYLKSYECEDCGGKGIVEFGHVSVAHDMSRCSRARWLRMRHPELINIRG